MEYQSLIEKFKKEHILRGISLRTIQGYTINCVLMLKHVNKHPWDIDEENLKQYIHHLHKAVLVVAYLAVLNRYSNTWEAIRTGLRFPTTEFWRSRMERSPFIGKITLPAVSVK